LLSTPPPPDLEHAARIASVPEALRGFVRRLGPLAIELCLGTDAQRRGAIPQLYKLASLEPDVLELSVVEVATTSVVRSVHDGLRFEARGDELDALEPLLAGLVATMRTGTELVAVGLGASAELARASALREVAGKMLGAPTVDEALAIFLTGVTAGSGLGFHRAAIYTHDPARSCFVGALGTGPADAEEAHRIWESIEADAVPFEAQLSRATAPSRFADLVRGGELGPGTAERDVVRLALDGRGPWFARDEVDLPAALRALDPADGFVLTELRARDHRLGLLYADRRFGSPEIGRDLVDALAAYVAQASVVWETLRLLREVEDLARYDLLTGLLNRREFETRFRQERARTRRGTASLSLLLIDLDHFRDVNNERGHEAGDELLRTVGRILRSELRANDIAARFGGDELVVLLPDAGPTEAELVARRIGRSSTKERISLSLGAATYPDDCRDPEGLVGAADARLYEAKRAGRGRGSVASGREPIVFSGS
jgi:diguanylate cyclase (GGDEF)-like protein